ncbi:hypothetical protein [Bradyrhizobium sp. NC92]|uniref:hypothetical protein n=1 Tax=Bradyrhizobium sp. (strain NC92) TaxID=55395 RepID=UPI0021AAE47D|nr:hypothetical protein [Bradyrhizobium sp. NC92]UWU67939.1 hypothetical protein N2602_32915 [Bradyrhizobium sp. NC92]
MLGKVTTASIGFAPLAALSSAAFAAPRRYMPTLAHVDSSASWPILLAQWKQAMQLDAGAAAQCGPILVLRCAFTTLTKQKYLDLARAQNLLSPLDIL